MEAFFLFWFWLGCLIFTIILAGQKNQSTPLWMLLYVFFGPLAFIALGFAPTRPKDQSKERPPVSEG